jgi:hypothetical protein
MDIHNQLVKAITDLKNCSTFINHTVNHKKPISRKDRVRCKAAFNVSDDDEYLYSHCAAKVTNELEEFEFDEV